MNRGGEPAKIALGLLKLTVPSASVPPRVGASAPQRRQAVGRGPAATQIVHRSESFGVTLGIVRRNGLGSRFFAGAAHSFRRTHVGQRRSPAIGAGPRAFIEVFPHVTPAVEHPAATLDEPGGRCHGMASGPDPRGWCPAPTLGALAQLRR